MGKGNYSATSNNMKLVHWPLTGGLLYLVQRGGELTESVTDTHRETDTHTQVNLHRRKLL